MKKILALVLVLILALSVFSLSSCSEEEVDDVKSFSGFVGFLYGEDSAATDFLEDFVPFATTRAALDCIFNLYDTAKTALGNIFARLSDFYTEHSDSVAEIIGAILLTIPAVLMALILVEAVWFYTILSLMILLLFFLYAILYDMALVSLYGYSLGLGMLFRTAAYLFVDLGLGKLVVQKVFSPIVFIVNLFAKLF